MIHTIIQQNTGNILDRGATFKSRKHGYGFGFKCGGVHLLINY